MEYGNGGISVRIVQREAYATTAMALERTGFQLRRNDQQLEIPGSF